MNENWKNAQDKGGFVGAIFMGHKKASDTMNYNLLIDNLGS